MMDLHIEGVYICLKRTLGNDVPPITDLIESGLLDSLALVSLILDLENTFSIIVSYDDLDINHFRTLSSLSNFIRQQLAK